MKALLVYFKGYVKDSILGPVFKLIEASFELLVPLVIAGIVDTTIPNKDKNHLFLMIFCLVWTCRYWCCRCYFSTVFFIKSSSWLCASVD